MSKAVVILGAGGYGVCTAVMLRRRGWAVTLVDKRPPACETSFGNAGIISESSCVPFNHPGLWRQLPRLLGGGGAAVHYEVFYLLRNIGWFVKFLAAARHGNVRVRAQHLFALITQGKKLHREWLQACGMQAHIRPLGWLKTYRSERSFAGAAAERRLWRALGVAHKVLSRDELAAYGAAFADVFAQAVLLEESFAVMKPGEVIRAYADGFLADGGRLLCAEAAAIRPHKNGWQVVLKNEPPLHTPTVVVALGPWTAAFLRRGGRQLPMAYEHGAHRHFDLGGAAVAAPFADMDGGFNATVHDGWLRLTTGIYFAGLGAKTPRRQLDAAERNLRQALPQLGAQVGDEWFGTRPTLPDCLPVLGATKTPGLWLAGGGQHIGFMTAPAAGAQLAAMLDGDTAAAAKTAAFSPNRFGL